MCNDAIIIVSLLEAFSIASSIVEYFVPLISTSSAEEENSEGRDCRTDSGAAASGFNLSFKEYIDDLLFLSNRQLPLRRGAYRP